MGVALKTVIRDVLAGLLVVHGSPALAQEANDAANTPVEAERSEPSDGERKRDQGDAEIVVTGSLIRGLPKEYVASPVFSYGKADIARSGASSLSQYMLTIPQNFTGDLSDFGSSGSGIGTTLGSGMTYNQYDGFASFALRGLASDATLTLLNGRRMASVGMIESPTVSVLPSALIERIDIISDGASATYGADAVAGVVNIVTRKPRDGLELRVRGATTTQTGARNGEASALAGHSWGSGNVYAMAMYQTRDAFSGAPILVGRTRVRFDQLPRETISGFYAGMRQEVGDLTFSVDASRFRRDRQALRDFPDTPRDNRLYKTRTTGYAVYGNAHWQGGGASSVDLNIDYGRNTSDSSLFSGLPPYTKPRTRYAYTNSLFTAELSGQTALASLPAGPIIVAGGAQYRREELTTTAKIFFNRNGGTRTTRSVFGEVSVPLVGPDQDIALVRSLSLSAAARYEDLGFDRAFAPKAGLRWQIDRSIALRGTYARSFLVPRFRDTIGIAEQVSFWNYPYAFLDPNNQNPLLPAGNAVVMYRSGANPGLKTQKADTFTAGIDLTPAAVPGLTMKTGYYRIRITGRVVTPSQDDSVTVPALQIYNTRNPTAAQIGSIVTNPAVALFFTDSLPFYTGGEDAIYTSYTQIPAALLANVQAIADIRPQNYAVETTDGLDIDLNYRGRLLRGDVGVHVTGQYILNLGLAAPGGKAVSRLDGYAQPSDVRLNGTLVWGRGGVSGGAVVNYVNGFTDRRAGRAATRIESYTTVTAFLGFDLGRLSSAPALRDSEVQFVVTNIFDRQPPRLTDAILGFDPYNNPPNPRTIGLMLTKRFR